MIISSRQHILIYIVKVKEYYVYMITCIMKFKMFFLTWFPYTVALNNRYRYDFHEYFYNVHIYI